MDFKEVPKLVFFVPYIDKHKAMKILSDMYESQNN